MRIKHIHKKNKKNKTKHEKKTKHTPSEYVWVCDRSTGSDPESAIAPVWAAYLTRISSNAADIAAGNTITASRSGSGYYEDPGSYYFLFYVYYNGVLHYDSYNGRSEHYMGATRYLAATVAEWRAGNI